MQITEGPGPHVSKLMERIYNALQACGPGWHPRKAIAQAANKNRLDTGDVAALELLSSKGLIEARQAEIPGPIPIRWEYRIKAE